MMLFVWTVSAPIFSDYQTGQEKKKKTPREGRKEGYISVARKWMATTDALVGGGFPHLIEIKMLAK